jgi:hypothetical protein
LAHVLGHDAVVCGVEGVFKVRVLDVDVFLIDFDVPHDDGGEGVVDAALVAESILLVTQNAVSFSVFRACIFD